MIDKDTDKPTKLFEESYVLAERLFLVEQAFIKEMKPTPQVVLIGIGMFAHVQIKQVLETCTPKAKLVARILIEPVLQQLADFIQLIQSFDTPKED